MNERNFVGLSVTADGYLACGSEDNAVYANHAGLPAPLAHHRLAAAEASLGAVRATPLLSGCAWACDAGWLPVLRNVWSEQRRGRGRTRTRRTRTTL